MRIRTAVATARIGIAALWAVLTLVLFTVAVFQTVHAQEQGIKRLYLELIKNGGFEESDWNGWSMDYGYSSFYKATNANTGKICAYFPGHNEKTANNLRGLIKQWINVPVDMGSAELIFWINITTLEPENGIEYDTLGVYLDDPNRVEIAQIALLSNLDKSAGTGSPFYKRISIRITSYLAPYKGKKVCLRFQGTTDNSNDTRFLIDDVSVKVAEDLDIRVERLEDYSGREDSRIDNLENYVERSKDHSPEIFWVLIVISVALLILTITFTVKQIKNQELLDDLTLPKGHRTRTLKELVEHRDKCLWALAECKDKEGINPTLIMKMRETISRIADERANLQLSEAIKSVSNIVDKEVEEIKNRETKMLLQARQINHDAILKFDRAIEDVKAKFAEAKQILDQAEQFKQELNLPQIETLVSEARILANQVGTLIDQLQHLGK